MQKKLIVGFMVGMVVAIYASLLFASQVGPMSYDEKGAIFTTGVGFVAVSSTSLASLVPSFAGEMVMCNTCTNGGGSGATGYNLCVGTATTAGAWVLVSSNTITCK